MSMRIPDYETHTAPLPGTASLLTLESSTALVVSGEFDAGTSDGLVAALDAAIVAGGDLVVDMTGVDFFDSYALRQVERAAQRLSTEGRSLRIANPPRIVTRLLYAARATDLLQP